MKKALLTIGLIGIAVGQALAQRYELTITEHIFRMGRQELGSNNKEDPIDNETAFRNGTGFGLRLTLNTRGYYGHEFTFTYSRVGLHTILYPEKKEPRAADTKVHVGLGAYNFLSYMMPRGSWIRPYLTVGLQAAQFENPKFTEGWEGYGTRNYGVNYGAGIKFVFGERLVLRIDARDYILGKPYELHFSTVPGHRGTFRAQEFLVGAGIGF